MENSKTKFSILMFPWLAYGHISPFLELAKKLSTKNFHIYFCSNAINLDSIKSNTTNIKHLPIEFVELHVPSLPDLPPELHTTKNLPSNLMPTLLHAFHLSSSSFSDILKTVKPDLLIYDFFQSWAPKLALSQGIPSVFFATSGATPFSVNHHLYTEGTTSTFPYQAVVYVDMDPEKIEMRKRMRSVANQHGANEADFASGNFKLSSDIVLVKSSKAVEEKYINYLEVLCKKRIVPTGPLVVHNDDDDNEEPSEILEWLSGKGCNSTVYISFGSECFLSDHEIEEIAKGLLRLCNAYNFVWIIRFPLGDEKNVNVEDKLPEGFLDMTKERGMVVTGWAPQARILSHPSIGGFVSHCGWSSVTESIYFGVPIIGMPMNTEQPINAKLVAEVGVGVEVEKDKNGKYVGEEIAKAISKVINIENNTSSEGLNFMNTARRLSDKVKENEGEELNEVAQQLLRLCMTNKQ